MTEPNRAVFLSYASQDVAAAARICDALRAAGIEVWFDQSELRGGDAWEQKIHQQIRECALFLPIISAATQARLEGYFRLEWTLADHRTEMIARSKPFILPVCVDDTLESGADVPESFLHVQWTRLAGGETPVGFCQRIAMLLSGTGSVGSVAAKSGAAQPAVPPKRPLLWMGVAVVGLMVAGGVAWQAWRMIVPNSGASAPATAAPKVSDKSVAVLPFVDMSEKKDQEYFSDGLSEELIDRLSRVQELRVPARTSSFYFKGKSVKIATIAKELGVAHVLEGSVRKADHTIRITVQLIRADNGYHLWSETYDRDARDIFKVQDEIAAAVVAALKTTLAWTPASSPRTSNPEAYNQYLLGNHLFNRTNSESFQRAIEPYRRAIALDPHYAAAYAGLAYAEFYVASNTGDVAGYKRAEAAAERAVALAPEEAEGYAARADLSSYLRWDWASAQADFAKALALDPTNTLVQRRYSLLLGGLGRLPEAIRIVRQVIGRDPLSNAAWHNLGFYLSESGDFAGAQQALRRALQIEPDDTYSLNQLAVVQLLQGQSSLALATFGRINDEAFRLTGIAMAEHSLGHAKESRQALDELIKKHAGDSAYEIAEVYAWRGEKDKAFEWLERAYRHNDGGLTDLKVDRLIDNLRGDPRYKALLRKLNLPET